jgi:predicted DCC family thiol-disulfide oxidoreductase YuxK
MKTVIYDGACKLCRITIDKAKKADAAGDLRFVDYTKDPVPPGVDPSALTREIHVVDDKGAVHRNADGILEMLAADPKKRWLVPLGRLPVVRTVLRWGYRLVARFRHGHPH